MSILNTSIAYPLLLISSTTKRSFEALGRVAKRSGDTIRRILRPSAISLNLAHKIAQYLFKSSTELTLAIDDTLLKKIYSREMVGSGKFFDTKIGRCITAYRLIAAALTNGRYTAPIGFGFMFAKELLSKDDVVKSKLDYIKDFFALAQQLFPGVKIKIAADGLFASVEFLSWCIENGIEVTVRMHSNRRVEFRGTQHKIREIVCLQPRGRQMARTIKIKWHGLVLYLTAERRIDKHGEESIVFLAATYFALPKKYVQNYKERWPIEKFFRTGKQYLGIAECFSTNLETQRDHVAATMFAYAIAQFEMKIRKFETPEQAIRAIKHRKVYFSIKRFARLDEIFGDVYA